MSSPVSAQDSASRLTRSLMVLGLVGVVLCLGLLLLALPTLQSDGVPDLNGVWLTTSPRAGLGEPRPALTSRAQADYDTHDPLTDPVIRCVPPGFPRSGPTIYPFEVVQTERMLMFVYETFSMVRRIYMDGRSMPEDLPPSVMGFSVGRWENGELVIHTTGYAPGLLAGDGVHQYGDMSVDERYRLVDEGLEAEMVITAPGTFQEPWLRRFTWEIDPEGMIYESICDPADSRF